MLSKLDQYFDFNTQALKLRSYRQQLLASNVANADTPNYKAVDIDFARELKRVSGKQAGALHMATTSQGHLQAASGNPYNAKIMYRSISQPNIDGNTVNMDEERAQFAENSLRYESTVRVLNGQIRGLMTAIKGV
ncbi:MAG: flagellar basal body rod protein FlgB [Burkholderiales bacterium]|nr:flagellar basal body rod protein FlgB [Burkholderiales bacterium]